MLTDRHSAKRERLRHLANDCFRVAEAFFHDQLDADAALWACVHRGLPYDMAISFLTTAIAQQKDMH